MRQWGEWMAGFWVGVQFECEDMDMDMDAALLEVGGWRLEYYSLYCHYRLGPGIGFDAGAGGLVSTVLLSRRSFYHGRRAKAKAKAVFLCFELWHWLLYSGIVFLGLVLVWFWFCSV